MKMGMALLVAGVVAMSAGLGLLYGWPWALILFGLCLMVLGMIVTGDRALDRQREVRADVRQWLDRVERERGGDPEDDWPIDWPSDCDCGCHEPVSACGSDDPPDTQKTVDKPDTETLPS